MSDQSTAEREEARADRDEKIEIAKEKLDEQESTPSKTAAPTAATRDPASPIAKDTRWWHRHLEPEERQRILAELGIKRQPHWAFRFGTMLSLSVIVAVMGQSANSAAVVIGAMLLAPLMQPVLAAAACISMALFRKSLQSIGVVFVATAGSILLAYLLAALLPTGELKDEVTSRTAPDLRDLVVALGAGTAGAYATVRKDVSSSLPGVAVAVALVPPLGAVGMSLEAGERTLATGAMLLYTTNLAAIVFAAAIVFLGTGFVPPKRLRSTFRRTLAVGAVVAFMVAAIAVPLYQASVTAAERTDRQLAAVPIVNDWIQTDGASATEAPTVDFNDERILVRVRSFDEPPDQDSLSDALRSEFGVDQTVLVEWDTVTRAVTTTTEAPSEDRILNDQIEQVANNWLQAGEFEGVRRIDNLTFGGGVVRVDASGVGEAPPIDDLRERLATNFDRSLEVQLTWVERRSVSAQAPEPTPNEILTSRIRSLTDPWALVNDVTVLDVSYDGVVAVVDVAGPRQPDATDLVADIEEVTPDAATVTVLFTERLDITTTTTTTTTTTPVSSVDLPG